MKPAPMMAALLFAVPVTASAAPSKHERPAHPQTSETKAKDSHKSKRKARGHEESVAKVVVKDLGKDEGKVVASAKKPARVEVKTEEKLSDKTETKVVAKRAEKVEPKIVADKRASERAEKVEPKVVADKRASERTEKSVAKGEDNAGDKHTRALEIEAKAHAHDDSIREPKKGADKLQDKVQEKAKETEEVAVMAVASAEPKPEAKPESKGDGEGSLPLLPEPVKSGRADKAKIRSKQAKKPPCLHEAVQFFRGSEEETFPLTRCDGSVAPLAVEHLSVLTRPGNVQKPSEPMDAFAKAKGNELTTGIRRMDAGLVSRLQSVVTHFAKPGMTVKVHVVSGYRPNATGSYHASGKALDFRIEGVSNEKLVDFCKSLEDTGCGYYPNSSFIHMDVREGGTGHVSWIDASGPGEPARYVASWPERTPGWLAHAMARMSDEDESTN